ncbi:hypothetical protein [Amycolatopsis aidingensis]|uniref:hypothetical protein n=1 Tax=Amycolatopsis aidingensis TaxID=2842453 RepID=UPI001C0C55FC|nr:hypothetical protein [Amycolatopsis aidingensis]
MSGGYVVNVEALQIASRGIAESVRDLEPGVVRGLCGEPEQYGHEGVHAAFAEFCERWDYGVEVLVDDTDGMCEALDHAVLAYVEGDQVAAEPLAQAQRALGGS